jgi:hypothetical protein
MGEINRLNYPELDKIMWDFHNQTVPAEQAFQIYEQRWRYVDEQHMKPNERNLLKELIKNYGNGVFMAA